MISIYHIDQNCFLYCNDEFEKITKNLHKELMNKGWEYWFSIIPRDEIFNIKSKLFRFFKGSNLNELVILKYSIVNSRGVKVCIKHEITLYYIDGEIIAINYFFDISDRQRIVSYLREATKDIRKNVTSKSISPREI